jgi:hypothetical protein
MTNFIAENDLSIAVADKFGQLFRNMSSDWQIAKQYQCAKTKTVCILNRALAGQICQLQQSTNRFQQ